MHVHIILKKELGHYDDDNRTYSNNKKKKKIGSLPKSLHFLFFMLFFVLSHSFWSVFANN